MPVGKSAKAFTLRERDLIPEGIAHDPDSGAFFVSSVHRRKIVRIAPGGAARDFVTEGQHGLWAVLALAVDPPRRALWACSTAVPEMNGYRADDKGRSGLFKLDVASGKLLQKIALVEPGVEHNLNDLAIDEAGNLFIADTASSAIYTLPAGGERLDIFVEPGKLASPQGIALSPDGKALFVADYARGIARIDRASRAVTFLRPPESAVVAGIDGLRFYNGDLLAIQNGIRPHRVVRLSLSPDGAALRGATVLEMNNPLFNEPTLGVVVKQDFFYVANSQWGSFDKGGVLWPIERLREPVILRLPLN